MAGENNEKNFLGVYMRPKMKLTQNKTQFHREKKDSVYMKFHFRRNELKFIFILIF